MGVVASRQLEARRLQAREQSERLMRDAERRSPEFARRRARIRGATRSARNAVKAREQAEGRLADALRTTVGEGISIREAAELAGVTYHEARRLIRAAEVAERAGGDD